MKKVPRLVLAGLVLLTVTAAFLAQNYSPPPSQPPDETTLKTIEAQTLKLERILATLRRNDIKDPLLVEVGIYHKAARWIVRHNEFYQKEAGQWTLDALDRGFLRASQAGRGEFPWLQVFGFPMVRAYRSRVDGSIQPYAVTWPRDYGKDPRKKWRLDVVLHGRDPALTEVKFLHQHSGDQEVPASQDFIRLDIFGRGNNAYRWAGETDVLEAVNAFVSVERALGREQFIDFARMVLRGFSMGGAGTWHLGLHIPDKWCVLGPGAGFTSTHGYVKDLPAKLPPWQESCLRIYDALDYAENAFNVPIVAYAGEKDPQLQAARNIEQRLKPLRIPMQLLVAPGLGHTFPPTWEKKAEEAYAPFLARGREEYPTRIHFVTYTLKYPVCNWITLLGLDRHYEKAIIDAEKSEISYTFKTQNIRSFRLDLAGGGLQPHTLTIDGQQVKVRPWLSQGGTFHLYLERRGQHWTSVLPQKLFTSQVRRLQKLTNLQGPIDDAYMESFLCVRGTGPAWHEATQKYAEDNLQRFREEWDKYLRGDLPVKDDTDLTEEDIAGRNLILFGDPASNSLIAQALDGLPLKWTKEEISLGGKTFSSAEHVPVMIYPSPMSTARYLVLNTGHTFHAGDFQQTNAMLYPRLGDYAVLKLATTEKEPLATTVAEAGLFDDYWQLHPDQGAK